MPAAPAPAGRRLKPPRRKPWQRADKRYREVKPLPSAWFITKTAWKLLMANWKLIGGILLVYGILNVILVRGLNGGADVRTLKSQVDTAFHGSWGHLAAGFTVFGLLLTSSDSASASATSGSYQTFLLFITSLALVWTLRQLSSDAPPAKPLRIRNGFYSGMYPLIPAILVLLVVGLQLIPFVAGASLYSTVVQNGVATNGLEQVLFLIIFLGLACLSLYWLCSSLFALYIVTLPDMTPMKALRSARGLVRYRRLRVLRKLGFLVLVLLIGGGIIMLPVILFAAVIAQWLFFVLTVIALALIHTYLYTLYRELLKE